MNKSDFNFYLPEELIAQHPAEKRENSRLLTLNKKTGEVNHRHFYDVLEYLNKGDCLILNNTKVIPARIYGTRQDTGSTVEFLLLRDASDGKWEALAGPGKKAKVGHKFDFSGVMTGEVVEVLENGNRIVQFNYNGSFYEILDKIGQMPLPHYIHEELKDCTRYQTVYAKHEGSAAAPTAGLHFTEELLEKIKEKGVKIGYVTLHVGIGTFRPVKEEIIENHKMHTEHYVMPKETADLINETKANGGRVICVGTTSCRTVETVAQQGIRECEGDTAILYAFSTFSLPASADTSIINVLSGK